jgi:ribose transport system permease protein
VSPSADPAAAPDSKRATGVPSRWSPVELGERYGILVLWAVIVVVFSILRPHTFATSANFETIFGTQAVQLVITLGLIVSLTAGEFDLSVY